MLLQYGNCFSCFFYFPYLIPVFHMKNIALAPIEKVYPCATKQLKILIFFSSRYARNICHDFSGAFLVHCESLSSMRSFKSLSSTNPNRDEFSDDIFVYLFTCFLSTFYYYIILLHPYIKHFIHTYLFLSFQINFNYVTGPVLIKKMSIRWLQQINYTSNRNHSITFQVRFYSLSNHSIGNNST